MPDKIEINNKINELNEELRTLQSDKTAYTNMINKIENLISNLSPAKDYMSAALGELKENYTGNNANAMYHDCQNVIDDIKNMIKSLKHEILPEARQHINTIDAKTTRKTERIDDLTKKIQ